MKINEIKKVVHLFADTKEYLELTNKHKEHHNDSAYNKFNIEKIEDFIQNQKKIHYLAKSNFVNRFKSRGLSFKIHELTYDNMLADYYNSEENRNYTEEEKLIFLKNKRLTKYFIVEREDTGEIIAKTQNEWGCLLIRVHEKYRGFSIGKKLMCCQIKAKPDFDSGGYTPSGYNIALDSHTELVLKAMASGFYSSLVKNGIMETKDALRITKSALVHKKSPKTSNLDLNLNSNDIRFYSPNNENTILMYNSKIFELIERQKKEDGELTTSQYDYFIDECLLGYSYVGGVFDSTETNKLFGFYAKNEKLKKEIIRFSILKENGEKVFLSKEQYDLIKDFKDIKLIERAEPHNKHGDYEYYVVGQKNTKEKQSLEILHQLSEKLRKKIDPYDEKLNFIHEDMYGKSEKKKLDAEKAKEEEVKKQLYSKKNF